MRTSIFAVVLTAASALAATQQVTYDTVYDDGTQSLDTVECAGLATSKIKTFGDFPDFPYIGGAAVVTGYNAPKCGVRVLPDDAISVMLTWALDVLGAGVRERDARRARDRLREVGLQHRPEGDEQAHERERRRPRARPGHRHASERDRVRALTLSRASAAGDRGL
jgi:hypothetical protein